MAVKDRPDLEEVAHDFREFREAPVGQVGDVKEVHAIVRLGVNRESRIWRRDSRPRHHSRRQSTFVMFVIKKVKKSLLQNKMVEYTYFLSTKEKGVQEDQENVMEVTMKQNQNL